jgi:peptide/nickel transport system permease protein
VSLLVGFIVATVSALVGTALGVMAAWRGGTIRAVVLRFIEVQLAFPFLVIAIAIIAVLSPSILTIIIILSAWIWVPFARVSYDGSLRLRNMEFISSARLAGYGSVYIVIRHVLPNIMGELIVIWTFSVAQAIVAESALSFLGLGIQPPTPSWGIMISEGKEVLNIAWWVMTVPAIILSCVVLAINLLGDFLRDRFDPVLASK